ncbi:hypothetical protein [Corynebacterium kroppenstedtii]|nr:hypothetical protein [uncultured Corynebacterium sp.]
MFVLALGVGRESSDAEPVPCEVVAVVARWGVRVEESARVVLQYSLD